MIQLMEITGHSRFLDSFHPSVPIAAAAHLLPILCTHSPSPGLQHVYPLVESVVMHL